MNNQMVRTDTGEVVDPYLEMDRLDEAQILAELKGASLDKMIYQFGTVTGLSVAGVRETVRKLNNNRLGRIRISKQEPSIHETEDFIEVRVYAEDEMNGGGNWGIKRQEKFTQGRNGAKVADAFALEKALSKAQRNALRALIPESFVAGMIKEFQQQQRRTDRRPDQARIAEEPRRDLPVPRAASKQPQTPTIEVINEEDSPVAEVLSMEDALGHKLLERARLSASKMVSHEPAGEKTTQHVATLLFDALGDEADSDALVKAVFGNGLSGLRAEQADFIGKWAGHEAFKQQVKAALKVAKAENAQAAS